jgi:hypothetical protein
MTMAPASEVHDVDKVEVAVADLLDGGVEATAAKARNKG